MRWKITALWGGEESGITRRHLAVTPFSGLLVFFEFLRRLGYRKAVRQHLPFRLSSPNAIDPVEIFTAFFALGGSWGVAFRKHRLLRANVALLTPLGIARFPVRHALDVTESHR